MDVACLASEDVGEAPTVVENVLHQGVKGEGLPVDDLHRILG